MPNEKGFTLVELLAALVLFSLITISAVTVTAQAMQQNTRAEVADSLRNDATYVTQALRTAYENGTLDKACLTDGKIVSENTNIELFNNKIDSVNFSYPGEDSSNCFNSQPEQTTLQVNFTIVNDNSKSLGIEPYTVNTAFTSLDEDQLAISISEPVITPEPETPGENDDPKEEDNPGGGDNPGDDDNPGNDDNPGGGDNPDEGDNPGEEETPGEGDDTPPTPPDKNTPTTQCKKVNETWKKGDYYGNTKTNETTFADWTYCNPFTVHDGSLWVTNGTTINQLSFTVEGYLFVAGDLTAHNTSTIKIHKDTDIKGMLTTHMQIPMETQALHAGDIKLETNSSISASKDVRVDRSVLLNSNTKLTATDLNVGTTFRMNSNSEIVLSNAFVVTGNTDFQSNTKMKVGTDMTIGKTVAQENTNIEIGNNLTVTGDINMTGNPLIIINGNASFKGSYHSENNSRIESSKNLSIDRDLTLKGSSKLYAKGDITINGNVHIQDTATLYADGDVHIKGTVSPNDGGGTICAKGKITIDKPNKASDLKILPNNQKCQK
ncbi:prepilin-type N-terminal cleavage/methylation domain-containing protein [Terribacillus saccharophilus]|uniref:prepilin-type N-terminal cleavage/methylation domain-containing protein n=1 Tax=Terribacillus saccharophilus TaxID=361277 RepID=UPI002989A568|nr:prepilin-type N-terminal cleavage/methylation domain-containing protein [Terribacillus saccharophilus]MCM3224338.1 FapA family protein [Terribacillus saccharophilus]